MIIEVIPNISNILAILLQTILPIAISVTHCIAACTLTTNSGTEVPNATNVNPTIIGEILIFFANAEDHSTNQSAPFTNSTNQIINNT